MGEARNVFFICLNFYHHVFAGSSKN